MTIPFFCVLVAFLLIMAPKLAASVAVARQTGRYDNNLPRDHHATLTGWGKRALAAHQNAIEAFPPFAAGVIVCHLAQGNLRWATILSLVFIAARVVYPILYIADLATLRSTVWAVGYAATAALFVVPLL
jgi:uncharacterized MAPEG superfamily protein